jgi:hypothetical protein
MSVILMPTFFAVIGSKFIMENIFELVWQFDFKVLIYLGFFYWVGYFDIDFNYQFKIFKS